MKILYWTELFYPHIGGVEVLSMHLLPALVARGHEVHVCASHSGAVLPDLSEFQGIPVHRFHFQKALADQDLNAIRTIAGRVADLKRSLCPDVIHLNTSQPGLFFHNVTSGCCPFPTLFTVHEPPARLGLGESLAGRVMTGSRWVAAVSRAMLEQARACAPAIVGRSSVLYNGLPRPRLDPAPLPFHPPRLLCMGRMVPAKGFDLALEILALVREHVPDTRLILAGDGPARPDLERRTTELGLERQVNFTGWIGPPDIPGEINRSTLVLFPSRWEEPFGLVALQAAQMARPVVAFAVGGLPEIIEQGRTGFCVQPGDVAAMADRVLELLTRPETGVAMGQAARSHVLARFRFEGMVDGLESLYRTVNGTIP